MTNERPRLTEAGRLAVRRPLVKIKLLFPLASFISLVLSVGLYFGGHEQQDITDERGRRGVWFFSLDITVLVPALVARVAYRLPFGWASMTIASEERGPIRRYTSKRRWPGANARSNIAVRIGARLIGSDLSELDHFLSARWALCTVFGQRLMWATVAHPPWPLYAAEVLDCDQSLVLAAGLRAPRGIPIARWSPGVEVRIGMPRPIPRSISR